MTRRLRGLFLVAPLVLVLAGCEESSPIGPAPPEEVTVLFDGTLPVNGANTHRFTTNGSGNITVTLEALSPAGTPTIAIALGVWTGASCNLIIVNDNAAVDANLIGTGTASGEFCARVYDVGRLTAPATYSLEVTHF